MRDVDTGDAGATEPVAATPRTATYDPPLTHCPLCRLAALRGFDRDFRGHRIDRCGACGVRVMNPQYTDSHLAAFYASYTDLQGRHGREGHAAEGRADPRLRAAAKRRCLDLMARHQPRKGRLLMVGCGDGLELRVAAEAGWQPEGLEVDPEVSRVVAAREGVPVHCGRLEDFAGGDASFDAVFLDQVIEHPKNPGDYLVASHRLLRDGGLLFLATPNIGSVSNRLKTLAGRLGLRPHKRGKHYNTRHHLFFFTPSVMARLLRRYGFAVVALQGDDAGRNPVSAAMSRWLPILDSGFLVLGRKAAAVEPHLCPHRNGNGA